MGTKLIRNSTAEFLIFTGQAGEQSIEARYEDEIVWLTQMLMAELFALDVRTVRQHPKNIFANSHAIYATLFDLQWRKWCASSRARNELPDFVREKQT